jgi:chemotaxis protein CheX
MGTTITSGFPLTMEIMPATIERALCTDLGQELEGIGLVDPALISALIRSIRNVFSTMLQLPVEVGTPSIKTGNERPHDVSGIIGMSGEVVGLVALSFAGDAAERIVASFTGARTSLDSEDFRDAIGELVGMVAGGAKGMLDGREVAISCPSVIVGANYGVGRFEGAPCVVIPCSTDCGEVMIEVAIEGRKQPEPAAAGASGLGADRRHLTRTPGPTGLQESPR